tara:strand:+ start:1426 stop:2040 length:615 start_codon:yes stop_codon:yes gene_type:complete
MADLKEELPESLIFHILRKGETEPIGPYSQDQIVELLNSKEINSSDLVYYPELTEWTPLTGVFDLVQEVNTHGSEGQDPKIVAESFSSIEKRLEEDEEVYYIAVQNFPAVSLTTSVRLRAPQSVILTNKRFCIIHPKLIGEAVFEEFLIEEVEKTEVEMEDDEDNGVFKIVPPFGDAGKVDRIPSAQLNLLSVVSTDLIEHSRA